MKKTIALLISFLLFSLLFGYSLVYWKWINSSDLDKVDMLSENIFSDSSDLNWLLFKINTSLDIKEYKVFSKCSVSSRFLGKKDDDNYFKITFLDNSCNNKYLSLKNKEETTSNFNFKIKTFSESKIFDIFSDLSDPILDTSLIKLNSNILKASKYKKYNNTLWLDYFTFMKKNRFYKELLYKQKILKNIINKRKNKYIIPVKWYEISKKPSRIPNAWRPYRESYTDWIHHWWDVPAPFKEDVIAIDDWVVVRVVREFSYEDLDRVKYWENLSYFDKTKNLDILRGKQVWLKTSKWDVVLYSHLNKVYSNIKEWDIIKVWTPVWTIWISWIPDRNYTDYHIHFSVQKNPYNLKRAGKYNFNDYMTWDWYFKWKSNSYILENQSNIFVTNNSLAHEKK